MEIIHERHWTAFLLWRIGTFVTIDSGDMRVRRTISTLAMATVLLASAAVQAQPVASAAVGAAPEQPQQQRPNVLVWMIDDLGFAQTRRFGGLVDTPNLDRLARTGLRYTNYHTAPICSASRAAFLTGRIRTASISAATRPWRWRSPVYDAHIPPAAGTSP